MKAHDLGAGLRLAVGTLTMIPVGAISTPTRGHGRWAMLLAPVAALPLALGAAFLAWGGGLLGLGPWVIAAVVLMALAMGTRAMHIDGLADTVDGIGGGWDRERALEVMRRGDVGPMGAAALVLILLVQAAAIADLLAHPWGPVAVGMAVVASRAACSLTCAVGVPPARSSGMGAVMAATVPLLGTVVTALGCALVLGGAATLLGGSPALGALAMAVAWLVVGWLIVTASRVFGGVTGDVMGAAIEVAYAALLVVLAAGSGLS